MFLIEQEVLGAIIALNAHQVLQEYGGQPMSQPQMMAPPQQQKSGFDWIKAAKYGALGAGGLWAAGSFIPGVREWVYDHSSQTIGKGLAHTNQYFKDLWNSFGATAQRQNLQQNLQNQYASGSAHLQNQYNIAQANLSAAQRSGNQKDIDTYKAEIAKIEQEKIDLGKHTGMDVNNKQKEMLGKINSNYRILQDPKLVNDQVAAMNQNKEAQASIGNISSQGKGVYKDIETNNINDYLKNPSNK